MFKLLFLFVFSILIGCDSEHIDKLGEGPVDLAEPPPDRSNPQPGEDPINEPIVEAPRLDQVREQVLVNRCYACHSAGTWNFQSDDVIMSIVVPGAAGESYLIQSLDFMPPSGPIPENEVQIIRDWINQGAEL